MEIAMIFTIMSKLAMDVSGMWPAEHSPEEETLEESVLLASLCEKCNIDKKLPKIEKFEKIQSHLLLLLQVRRVLEEENFKTQQATQSYIAGKVMSESPWRRLRFVIEEAINQHSQLTYEQLIEQERLDQLLPAQIRLQQLAQLKQQKQL
jgi:hypothetical protein